MDRDIRRGELRRAMAALGVAEPIFLGYRDSGMENWPRPAECFATADAGEVVARLVEIIRELRPATVLTFDPGGIYGHPDHVAISAHATAAYWQVAAEGGRPCPAGALPRGPAALRASSRWAGSGTSSRRADGPPPAPTEDDLLQARRFGELARPDEEITARSTCARAGPEARRPGGSREPGSRQPVGAGTARDASRPGSASRRSCGSTRRLPRASTRSGLIGAG